MACDYAIVPVPARAFSQSGLAVVEQKVQKMARKPPSTENS
jgi:hypothetical protein